MNGQTIYRVIAKFDNRVLNLVHCLAKEWVPHLNVMRFDGTTYIDCDFILQITRKSNSTKETEFHLGKIE